MASVYVGILGNEGIWLNEEDAFEYAKDHLDELNEADRKEFVEWFFSGDVIKKGE